MIYKALIALTPSESKKLIGIACAYHKSIREAYKEGIIVIHPSTTTYYLYKQLIGKEPPKPLVCGMVTPKGLCISKEGHDMIFRVGYNKTGPSKFTPWIIVNGKEQYNTDLGSILPKMGEGDVYVKTGNAIDPNYNVGVLFGGPEGGTIGLALKRSREQGFKILIPIGLEKMIPLSIDDASRIASFDRRYDYSMGMPCGLLKIDGEVITEIEAIKILTGAEAYPIASGGLEGGEGSIVLVIKGDSNQINKLKDILREVKGNRLPSIEINECKTCKWKTCPWRGASPLV